MTELAVPEQHNAVAVSQPAAPQPMPSELVQWVESARQASLLAQSLAKTSFAGAYRNKPEEATAAILTGQELGLKPMASLKSIDVIQGQPALRAHAMRAIVQGKGHEIELIESDDTHCVMRGRRKGAEGWQQVVWTIARARLLGLLGKGEWKKQPQTMLVARATGEICRLIASDALHGMPYAAEELTGTTEISVEQVRAPLSVSAITATPTPAANPEYVAPEADDELAPHEWDIHTVARALGMSEADLDERCYGVTGAPLADASDAQVQALFQELAGEMVARDSQ